MGAWIADTRARAARLLPGKEVLDVGCGPDSRSVLVVGSGEIAIVERDGTPRTSLKATGPTTHFTAAVADAKSGLVCFSREGSSAQAPAGLFQWDPATGKERDVAAAGASDVPLGFAPGVRTLYVGGAGGRDYYAPRTLAAIDLETGTRSEIATDASRELDFRRARDANVGAWTRSTMKDVAWAELSPGGRRGTLRGRTPALSSDGRFVVVERSQRLVLVELATGIERDLGQGIRPRWYP
jgi:hypothetical protein